MIVDTMSKTEVLDYIAEDYASNIKRKFAALIPLFEKQTKRLLKPGQKKMKFPPKSFMSPSNILYTLVFYGFRNDFRSYVYTEFEYKERHIYASILDDGTVTAYSTHCLKRYAERQLLKPEMAALEVFTYLFSDFKSKSFACALPSPTHELTGYCVQHDALFFCDFNLKDNRRNWYNTCISIREMRESQTRLYRAFADINDFVNIFGFDPIDDIIPPEKIFKFLDNHPEYILSFTEYLKKRYMFGMLVLSFKWEWVREEDINVAQNLIKAYLEVYEENVSGLSPFGEKNGIVFRDEIMYKGPKS